jgi:hypothetical protein
MSEFTIFLSHRSKDALAAGELRAILEGLDETGALRVIVSENIPKGEDWRVSIQKALVTADRFLLLYTDPSQKWDWCLYESGFFSGVRLQRPKAVAKFITLHAVDVEPPSPLSQWQTVKGDVASVQQLLEELFCQPLREKSNPIARKLSGGDRLKAAAERIANLIRPGPRPDWYSSFVRVVLTPAQVDQVKAKRHIPGEAAVEAQDPALELFNVKLGSGLTWERLGMASETAELEELNRQWRNGVSEAAYSAINGVRSLPQLPMFYSHDGKCYHAFLQRLDKMPDNSVRVYVVFTEFHAEDDPRPPGDLGILTHMLTLGRNFRWGVVEPYATKFELLLTRESSADAIADAVSKLESALARALNEGARAQLLVAETAMTVFTCPLDKNKIKEVYREWRDLQPGFTDAMARRDLKAILAALGEFRRLNSSFLEVAAKRLYEMLSASNCDALPISDVFSPRPSSSFPVTTVTQ